MRLHDARDRQHRHGDAAALRVVFDDERRVATDRLDCPRA
jgi:hypothetical protein